VVWTKPGSIRVTEKLVCGQRPPCCAASLRPELNPVEQLGDLVKDAICNQNLLHPQAVEEALTFLVASANACAKY